MHRVASGQLEKLSRYNRASYYPISSVLCIKCASILIGERVMSVSSNRV